MPRSTALPWLLTSLAALGGSQLALAAGVTVHTDPASFEAALPVSDCGPVALDFEELAFSEVLSDQYADEGIVFSGLEPPEIDDAVGAGGVACADTRCARVPTDTYWEGDDIPDYVRIALTPATRALSLRLIALGEGPDGDEEAATVAAWLEGAPTAGVSFVPGASTLDGGVWVGLVFDDFVDTVTITAQEPGDMIGFDDVWWLSGECEDWDGDGATVAPGAEERCDGLDNDCDGQVAVWELDTDYDGQMDCVDTDDDGVSTYDGDCDPWDGRIYPGALDDPSVCDGLDNDCDGLDPWDADGDFDGHPDCQDTDMDGVSTYDGDCDPWDGPSSPNQPEVCDGLDNDCDGRVPDDELDEDGDLFRVCDGDCDDHDELTHPYAGEDDNGLDSNCDGERTGGQIGCATTHPGPLAFPALVISLAGLSLRRRAPRRSTSRGSP